MLSSPLRRLRQLHGYEQIARDWQNLAASYELTESLEHFIIAIEQMKEAARTAPPFPHGPGASPARRAGGAAAADVLPALRAARAHR